MKGHAYRTHSESTRRPATSEGGQWVVFALDAGRYALPLASVERIVRAAEITPLPRAPALVLGVIDLAGRVLPVFDIRQRFGLPSRPLDPADQFLIGRTSERAVAIVVNETHGLIEHSAAVVPAGRIAANLDQIEGVIKLEDGMVLIHDLERFLSADESRALDEALKDAPHAT